MEKVEDLVRVLFEVKYGKGREEFKKVEDIFKYLERVYELVVEENYKPVLILDEMQTIEEVVNTTGKPVISGLFNFLYRDNQRKTFLPLSLCNK